MRESSSEWLYLKHASEEHWRSVLSLTSLPALAYLFAPHTLAWPASNLSGLLSVLSLFLSALTHSDLSDLGLASALSLSRLLVSR